MTSTNPKIIDGKTYDLFSINLAITGKYKTDGTPDASVAMRLIPTRVEDGNVETQENYAVPIYLGNIKTSDPETQQAITAVMAALQAFISDKEL